jgi:hypothetical protein
MVLVEVGISYKKIQNFKTAYLKPRNVSASCLSCTISKQLPTMMILLLTPMPPNLGGLPHREDAQQYNFNMLWGTLLCYTNSFTAHNMINKGSSPWRSAKCMSWRHIVISWMTLCQINTCQVPQQTLLTFHFWHHYCHLHPKGSHGTLLTTRGDGAWGWYPQFLFGNWFETHQVFFTLLDCICERKKKLAKTIEIARKNPKIFVVLQTTQYMWPSWILSSSYSDLRVSATWPTSTPLWFFFCFMYTVLVLFLVYSKYS